MILRRHQAGDCASAALFSACGAYRYRLTRHWGPGPGLLFVMLNPSTADEARNDPTVARCEARARATGCGALAVVNLFAFRATDPRALLAVADPVGPGNDAILAESADRADQVICAWGNAGRWQGRDAAALAQLRASGRPLFHLGLSRLGQPMHPLYRPAALAPVRWD